MQVSFSLVRLGPRGPSPASSSGSHYQSLRITAAPPKRLVLTSPSTQCASAVVDLNANSFVQFG